MGRACGPARWSRGAPYSLVYNAIAALRTAIEPGTGGGRQLRVDRKLAEPVVRWTTAAAG